MDGLLKAISTASRLPVGGTCESAHLRCPAQSHETSVTSGDRSSPVDDGYEREPITAPRVYCTKGRRLNLNFSCRHPPPAAAARVTLLSYTITHIYHGPPPCLARRLGAHHGTYLSVCSQWTLRLRELMIEQLRKLVMGEMPAPSGPPQMIASVGQPD
ncbi:uncharacterized protein PG986_001392 [Apiospora aurea]|uniref:Uncharacterized protein n=1 Tax=Apiospora aurea TaxID=335848 RepID=A0ABR1QWQ2_9PEZI